jgi:hypothetical protein
VLTSPTARSQIVTVLLSQIHEGPHYSQIHEGRLATLLRRVPPPLEPAHSECSRLRARCPLPLPLAARGTSSLIVMTKSLSPTQTRPRTLHSHILATTHQHTALVGQECEDAGYEFTRATGAFLHPPLPGAPEPRFRPIGRPQVGVVPFGPA